MSWRGSDELGVEGCTAFDSCSRGWVLDACSVCAQLCLLPGRGHTRVVLLSVLMPLMLVHWLSSLVQAS